MKKKSNAPKILAAFVGLIFIVAILVFLFTKSEYLGYEITGLEVVKSYGAGFWIWAVVGLAGSVVAGYVAYANYSGSGALGRKLRGNIVTSIVLVIISLACLCGPWTRACTDKANGGVGIKKAVTLLIPGFQFLNDKCDHVYVAVEKEKVSNFQEVQASTLAYSVRYGVHEGKEIVCVKCKEIKRQLVDYGNRPVDELRLLEEDVKLDTKNKP